MASDITGFNIYNRQKESFEFKGLVMCNLLGRRVNRASPKTQSALLEAMEETGLRSTALHIDTRPLHGNSYANPTGYVGTYPLPAQLDRFALKIRMGYPSAEEEIDIIVARRGVNRSTG